MRLIAGLLLISLSLVLALEVPPLLGHKFSSSIDPCDDFVRFACNMNRNYMISPFYKGMDKIFGKRLDKLFNSSTDSIFETIMPLMLEEALKEASYKKYLGLFWWNTVRVVLEPHNGGYRLYVHPLAYRNERFNLSSSPLAIQGFIKGHVKVTGHKIETVNVHWARLLTDSYFKSAQNITDQEERGRLMGDAVANGRQHFPKVLINGTNMEIDFRRPPEWRTYKECPATIQGILDAYIETHKNKTIILGNSKILLDFEVDQVEEKEMEIKFLIVDQKLLSSKMNSTAPKLIEYGSLLEYGIALDNNLISKKTRHDFERIFRAVKQEFLSTVQNTTWLAEDSKKRISDHLNSVVIEKPESSTEVRTLITDIQRDFVALKNTIRTPENCNATCLSRLYVDLAAQAYSKHIKLEHYGVRGTLQIRNDSTLVAPPQYLYLTDDSIPVAHKFGRFGVAVAGQLFRSVKPFLEQDSPKKFDVMQIAIRALNRDLGPGDEDLKRFFYSAALNMCEFDWQPVKEWLYAMEKIPQLQKTFQCKSS
ncbi:hypothetical protein QR680_014190 [Steinernema hermaphroditum]|uniref:Peptidase M13 N-terminal domain-containing protein n=1 Tax=Steinernema hermaphroditum TaxID=289476 RepID=A0AA39I810_9BILA|nr:hypothetical protein QR680_014190 [Steinernema hermaphroditum]